MNVDELKNSTNIRVFNEIFERKRIVIFVKFLKTEFTNARIYWVMRVNLVVYYRKIQRVKFLVNFLKSFSFPHGNYGFSSVFSIAWFKVYKKLADSVFTKTLPGSYSIR